MLSRRGAPRDSPSGSPRSETTAREEPSSRVAIRAAGWKASARAAAAAAAARTGETAYDDSVGASSDSLLDMAVRRVVLDLDGRVGDLSSDPADARAAGASRNRAGPEPEPPLGALGTRERIGSLPPDLAQVVFDAVVAAKRLGAGGVSLARQFKYLWVVDLAACGDVAEDDVVNALLATNARTLLRLSLARCRRLTEASLRALERRHEFPALTYLDLSECATVTDETLACVTRAPNLETLKAEGCAVVGGGLRHVAKLEKLKHLSLERCSRLGSVTSGDVGDAHSVEAAAPSATPPAPASCTERLTRRRHGSTRCLMALVMRGAPSSPTHSWTPPRRAAGSDETAGSVGNSHSRSSRSWRRASERTAPASSARRWTRARVCSTESCRWVAVVARSRATASSDSARRVRASCPRRTWTPSQSADAPSPRPHRNVRATPHSASARVDLSAALPGRRVPERADQRSLGSGDSHQ